MEQVISEKYCLHGRRGNLLFIDSTPGNFYGFFFLVNFRSELDIDSKKWRLRADFINDVAMGIEIFMLPRFPEMSTYILCATTTMKAIVGVTGGN